MAAGTAAKIGIAGTAGATISGLWRGAAACNEYHMKGRLLAAGAHDQATEDREGSAVRSFPASRASREQ
jgi:hypothetical protein